jgi:hypothetical protein
MGKTNYKSLEVRKPKSLNQNDKIHSQVEAMTDLERQKTELKFEVCKGL